jgi:Alpha/beta hydrolase domain
VFGARAGDEYGRAAISSHVSSDSKGLRRHFRPRPPRQGFFAGRLETCRLQVDADGKDLAGIRSVFLQTPIGTHTGWNLGRKDRFENGMCNLQGSFVPFAATKAERIAAGDPRLSIEERYPTKDAYPSALGKPQTIS